jgi:hypothetical protein
VVAPRLSGEVFNLIFTADLSVASQPALAWR